MALAITGLLTVGLIWWNPEELYFWFKAVHVIAAISWMAAMLYLPRLFVYHCAAEAGSQQSETFKIMERRLLRAIMNPAMVVTWVIGLWLAIAMDLWTSSWFHGKLLLLLV
ncbi:MAG: CopD family protein, partial [Alphaproteobacteria bacterium]